MKNALFLILGLVVLMSAQTASAQASRYTYDRIHERTEMLRRERYETQSRYYDRYDRCDRYERRSCEPSSIRVDIHVGGFHLDLGSRGCDRDRSYYDRPSTRIYERIREERYYRRYER